MQYAVINVFVRCIIVFKFVCIIYNVPTVGRHKEGGSSFILKQEVLLIVNSSLLVMAEQAWTVLQWKFFFFNSIDFILI